ncbi:SDR family NAD(P)-dependent oxidoreductase [Nocardia sp. NPDC058658]|uniref:SDR family NAD(P)-dependent oxidoreductase n=1 Tax=Nocardia sp. NPDC058658 TaxID=3346580 RepID=UPI00366091C4
MYRAELVETTLTHLLFNRAESHRDRVAFAYLPDGETIAEQWTFGELREHAQGVADWLCEAGAGGERVLLLHENHLHFIAGLFGCALAGAVAVPAYSPVGKKQVARIGKIVDDSGARFALSSSHALHETRAAIETFGPVAQLRWCASDSLPLTGIADRSTSSYPAADPDDVALLQYTSGSTSDPKGVMITHRNFLDNVESIRGALGSPDFDNDISGVFWLPLHHDMGLVGAVLASVYLGVSTELMSPASFVLQPIRWLERISRHRDVITTAPNFAHELCVTMTTPLERSQLDLSGWRTALCGAEFVRAETMRRFADAFAPAGFDPAAAQPVYGMAEATLLVTGSPRPEGALVRTLSRQALQQRRIVEVTPDSAGSTEMVGCGRVQNGLRLVIVDPETRRPCAADEVGEIWIASPSVARGYWRNDEATEATFGAQLVDPGVHEVGPYLRTGDLGFVRDDELFVVGRLKDLIILRGRNLYPDDIEGTVAGVDSVLLAGRGAAFSVENEAEERLVIVQEIDRDAAPDTGFDDICRRIAMAVTEEHEAAVSAVVLTRAYSLPSTSSGKVQRFACREKFEAATLKVVARWAPAAPRAFATATPAAPPAPGAGLRVDAVADWLVAHLARELGVDKDAIDPRQPFAYYGMDSVRAVKLAGAVGLRFGVELRSTIAYEYPTIAELAEHLCANSTIGTTVESSDTPTGRHIDGPMDEPLAIVGIGCRFPGADNPDEYWELLRNGVDAIGPVPVDRWSHSDVRWGGFLRDVRSFDAGFFGISAREAEHIDPQQRLLLELAVEAFDDAGIVTTDLAGQPVAVLLGISTNDYGRLFYTSEDRIDAYTGTGNALSVAANRISYHFDFRGPSAVVDTACSSSLVALHNACATLRSGEATMAVVGGVNLLLSPSVSINMHKAGVMAADGRCKTFDAAADGYVRSEGAGVVIVEPLSRAVAAGRPVYAVISGSATNQDGRTNGIMAPSRTAQVALLRQAYRNAGIRLEDVAYVEAHGTGTLLGDAIEANALADVFAAGRTSDTACAIGSVKSNIGHLEAAAGIAGVIKVALAMRHGAIPPSLHYRESNPDVDAFGSGLRVATAVQTWPDGPRVAGVSSFGFGGSNAHVVLSAPTSPPPRRASSEVQSPTLLRVSANDRAALIDSARRYHALLSAAEANLADIAYSAAVHRTHRDDRLALVAATANEAADHLAAFLRGEGRSGLSVGRADHGGRPRVAFVFSGQGSQWLGMGRALFADEPVFRDAMISCDRELRHITGWSPIDELHATEERSRLSDVDVVQPMIFAVQVALAALWRSWGVVPDAVVGHSMGEVAAAHVAGILDLADAATVIAHRSALLRTVAGAGAMAVVEMSPAEVAGLITGEPVTVAAINGPRSTVLSGEPDAVQRVLEAVRNLDVFCRAVAVDVASHGPQMDPLRGDLVAAAAHIAPRVAEIPMYSTVSGVADPAERFDAGYWGDNLRQPVLFGPAIDRMIADGFDLFVEVSPHPVLIPAIVGADSAEPVTALPSSVREDEDRATVLATLGALYCRGVPVARSLAGDGTFVALPRYPWQRAVHWIDGDRPATPSVHVDSHGSQRLASSIHADTEFWQWDIDLDRASFLRDHCVQHSPTAPAALHAALLAATVAARFGAGCELDDLRFAGPLSFEDGIRRTWQLSLVGEIRGGATFRVSSSSGDGTELRWESLSEGMIRALEPGVERPIALCAAGAPDDWDAQIHAADFYRMLDGAGLNYGPAFRRVETVWRRDNAALARLSGDTVRAGAVLDPAVAGFTVQLDAAFQVLAATVTTDDALGESVFLPVGLARLRVFDDISTARWCYMERSTDTESDPDNLVGSFQLLSETGQVVAQGTELRVRHLRPGGSSTRVDGWFHQLDWQQTPPTPEPASGTRHHWVVVADSRVGSAVSKRLIAEGQSVLVVRPGTEYRVDAFGTAPIGVVYTGSDEDRGPAEAAHADALHLLYLAKALGRHPWKGEAPRLFVVTRASQAVEVADRVSIGGVAAATCWGVGRTIEHELPELRCTRIDLSESTDEAEIDALWRELGSGGSETELALRSRTRFVARLCRVSPPGPIRRTARLGEGFALSQQTPGLLEDLVLGQAQRRAPAAGEVEIEISAAGLNFHDVAVAVGLIPPEDDTRIQLGGECVGTVCAVGPGVDEVACGDVVAAIASPAFGAFVTTSAELVVPIPDSLDPVAASSVPIAFVTAYHALCNLAQLRAGERVLIHAATGGVGLAAIALARRIGAEIYATAGSPAKREYLRELGIEHVMDSRTVDFAEEIRRDTAGVGVDVIVNSLSGIAIRKGLEVLAPYGRFVEIGKRDVVEKRSIDLWQLRRNIAHFTVDVAAMAVERPAAVGAVLREVVHLVGAGELAPLPTTTFPLSQAEEAFRLMATAGHIGKVVLTAETEPEILADTPRLEHDGQYLVTGGFGALGIAVAESLVAQGARHLVLAGRRGPGPEAGAAIARIRAAGARVVTSITDVSRADQVDAMVARIDGSGPPLRGVVHAAGTLADAIIDRQDANSLAAVLLPKAAGAWHLHTATRHLELDFMVFFSSASGVLGAPGQSNYAGANAFLDALATHRRGSGLPATSIAWGPWREIGLAGTEQRVAHVSAVGLGTIAAADGLSVLERIMVTDPVQTIVLPIDGALPAELADLPRFAELLPIDAGAPAGSPSAVLERLRTTDEHERGAVVEDYLAEVIARRLGADAETFDRDRPLRYLGLDSIGAMELRTRIERDLPVTVPVVKLLEGPSVTEFAGWLLSALDREPTVSAARGHVPADADIGIDDRRAVELLADLDALSDHEVEQLLADVLAGEGEGS